jgi:hypothetical protein
MALEGMEKASRLSRRPRAQAAESVTRVSSFIHEFEVTSDGRTIARAEGTFKYLGNVPRRS